MNGSVKKSTIININIGMLLIILSTLLSFMNKLNATLIKLNIENTDIVGMIPSFFALTFNTSKGEVVIYNLTIITIVQTIIINIVFALLVYRERIYTRREDSNEELRDDS